VRQSLAGDPDGEVQSQYKVTQQVTLEPGDNRIEVADYNASDLLTSLPAHATIKFTGTADQVKPKLHVLAIGSNNKYVDSGCESPGSTKTLAFPPAEACRPMMQRHSQQLSKRQVSGTTPRCELTMQDYLVPSIRQTTPALPDIVSRGSEALD